MNEQYIYLPREYETIISEHLNIGNNIDFSTEFNCISISTGHTTYESFEYLTTLSVYEIPHITLFLNYHEGEFILKDRNNTEYFDIEDLNSVKKSKLRKLSLKTINKNKSLECAISHNNVSLCAHLLEKFNYNFDYLLLNKTNNETLKLIENYIITNELTSGKNRDKSRL